MAEDPDAIPSMQLAWEMIELARVIYKQREKVNFQNFFRKRSTNSCVIYEPKNGSKLAQQSDPKMSQNDRLLITSQTFYFSQWSATSRSLNVTFDWVK